MNYRTGSTGLAFVRGAMLASAAICTLSAQGAAAQAVKTDQARDDTPASAAAEAESEIIVTGIRRSIQQSIDVKRDSAGVVDAITAEDIGKLPDQNVVDTLQRISGVQIDRGRGGNQQTTLGEGTGFTVRGISQNRVEFNGTNLIGAAGSGDVQLGDFNPDILAGLTVTKSPSAQEAEGAIGGVVNLITRKPLDQRSATISGRVEGIHYDQAEKIGYRASAAGTFKLFNDRLGILVGASRSDYDRNTHRFDTDGYVRTNAIDATGDRVADPGLTRPNRMVFNMLYANIKRDGLNGSVQWRPSDIVEVNFDAAYTRSQFDQDAQRFQFVLNDAVTGAEADENGTVFRGTYTNPTVRPAIFEEISDAKQKVFALHGKWSPGPLTVEARAAHSEGKQLRQLSVPLLTPKAGRTATLTTDFRAGTDIPNAILNPSYDILNPANFLLNTLVESYDFINNDGDEARLDLRYETSWPWLSALRVGARFEKLKLRTDRRARNASPAVILAANPGADLNKDGVIGGEEVPGFDFSGLPTNNFFDGRSGDFPRNWLAGTQNITEVLSGLGLPPAPRDLSGVRAVDQKTKAAYIQADIDGAIGSLEIKGNVGVRYVDSKRDASGFVIAPGLATYTTVGAQFRDWLPSINLRTNLTEDLLLRFAAAKVLARPPLASLSPGTSLNVVNFIANRGNPNLRPFKATQFDASLEWYFAPASILSLTGFYKKVNSFTVNTTSTEFIENGTFSGNYLVTQPTNGSDGTIKGFEVGYQQVFRGLPRFLEGLGVGGSYTFTDSRTPLINSITGDRDPLQGLSKHSYNATAFIEQDWGNFRVTYNWRDKYLDSSVGAALGGNLYAQAYGQLDASLQINLTEEIKLTAEAVNLSKNPERLYHGFESRLRSYNVNDRRIYFGVSAAF